MVWSSTSIKDTLVFWNKNLVFSVETITKEEIWIWLYFEHYPDHNFSNKYLNKSKDTSLWCDCGELARSNMNFKNSGHKLFPSSSIKFRETSATKSTIFLLMLLFGSFWSKVKSWALNWLFCSSGKFLKNSVNSEDRSLLNITADNWRPSSGTSPPGVRAAKSKLAFWSKGRLS